MVEKITNIELEIISLFRKNYLEKYHTREIAKLLKKNHVTLLPHLKSLEKDKILKSKKNGRNKEYFLNFENIITKNYLLFSELFETIKYLEENFLIKKITEELFNLNFKGSIILFGSYAKKTYKEDSDIDLFYLGRIKDEDVKKIKSIGEIYGKTINIKKTTLKNFKRGLKNKDPLTIEIIKNHIILQKPEEFINTLWRHYNEYAGGGI